MKRKQGIVYIEALIASVIAIVLIVSVSKLIFVSSEILKSNREKGYALDIIRGVGELYKSDKLHLNGAQSINLNNIDDIYNSSNEEKDFTLHIESTIEEELELLKMKLASNNKRFEEISMVVAK